MVKELSPGDRPECPGDRARRQVSVITAVHGALNSAGIPAWLFGGWGLDAHLGAVTRDHSDVEFWVERTLADRSAEVLVGCGAVALATQPPEESREFAWNEVQFSTAYFDRRPDGSFKPQGRWSDWTFPACSFGDGREALEGAPVRS